MTFMKITNRNNILQEQKRIERLIILGLFFFQFVPISNITIRFIVLFVFLLSCLFNKHFYGEYNKRYLTFIISITIFLSFYHGLAEAKDFFIFCFGILSTYYFSTNYSFSGNIIYKYFLYVIIPLSLFNFFVYQNVFYLPFTNGQVNILGGESTKHGTALIGTVLFVGAGYNILTAKSIIRRIDIIFLIIGIYLVIFSGSRSCLLALFATIFLYMINRNKYRKFFTIVYFYAMIILVFFMEYIQDYVYLIDSEFILDLIHVENFERHGVTSGRAWLWGYHWDCFINSSYLLGSGRDSTDLFLGDFIPSLNMVAKAGSESPYTKLIACYGIIGFFMLCILIYLSHKAINKENKVATCIVFVCVYNTVMGVDLTNVLMADPILLYILYYSSFNTRLYNTHT